MKTALAIQGEKVRQSQCKPFSFLEVVIRIPTGEIWRNKGYFKTLSSRERVIAFSRKPNSLLKNDIYLGR